jgi:hypothetical protein
LPYTRANALGVKVMSNEYKSGWVEKTYKIDDCEVMININPDETIANIYAYADGKPFLEEKNGKEFRVKWVKNKRNKLFINVAPDRLEGVYKFLVDNDYLYELEEDREEG